MFVYILETSQNIKIKTPYKLTSSQFKQSADLTINSYTYENGWNITMKQYTDHVEVISNKELLLDTDCSYVLTENH